MTVKYHIGKAEYNFFLRREGSGDGKLSSQTFEGLVMGMIESWLPQDVKEGLELILDKTLTPDQIKLISLVKNMAERYEELQRITGRPFYQLADK